MDNGFDYKIIEDNIYLYPESNVLVNKLGITDEKKLIEVERMITSLRSSQLEENFIAGNLDLNHLQTIHKYLFKDIYEWAGEIRKVDIIKGNSQFCHYEYIEDSANDIFKRLKEEHYLRNLEKDLFINKLSEYIGELNALHPFREGNGRTQRIFINYLANLSNYELDFELVEKEEITAASIDAFYGKYDKYINIFNKIIKDV